MTARLGRLTVRADGLSGKAAVIYEATIMGMLRSFQQWETGRALARVLAFYNQPVLIFPYDGNSGSCNATASSNHIGLQPNEVSFSPQMWNGVSSCYPVPAYAGGDPHEVLFHELVHAARGEAGLLKTGAYDEAIAIVCANVFSSERNRPVRNPADHGSMSAFTSDPVGFMQRNTGFLSHFYHEMPEFFRWIAEVRATYNPLRLYYLTVLRGVPRLNSAP